MQKRLIFFVTLIMISVAVNSRVTAGPAEKLQPIIGISIDNGAFPGVEATKLGVIEQVQLAGEIPIILNDRGDRSPEKDIKQIDGLIVQGDALDIDPAEYGEKKHKETKVETDTTRTKYENKIIAEALQDKVPVLLICGGMQRANVILGGTLHQHIPDLHGVKPGHGDNNGKPLDVGSVTADILPGSQMEHIIGKDTLQVNSHHHQALDKIGNGLRVAATSDVYARPDGKTDLLVEAVEADPKGKFAGQYILGLQFHPELMPGDPMSSQIFGSFAKAAQKFAADTGRRHEDEDVIRKIAHKWAAN
jgi:putative glutamine amidotransferase